MENNDNNDQDPPNSDPIEDEATKSEKPSLKSQAGSSRRTVATTTHYSDLRHFQRLVNEYQKNPEDLPR